jgi:hypothetical protein
MFFGKIKPLIRIIITALNIYAIIFCIFSLIFGSKFLIFQYSEEDNILLILVVFLLIIGIIFISIPSIIYFLWKKDYSPTKKLLIPIAGLIFGLYIGPFISINLTPYSYVLENLESYAIRGHWNDVNKSYKALYFKHPKDGVPYIRRCQTKLKMASYYYGEINGLPTNELPAAIIKFQRDFGLPENQKIDDNTNTILVSYISPNVLDLVKEEVHFNNILKINAKVKLFQTANNLDVDGWIGTKTEVKILEHNLPLKE